MPDIRNRQKHRCGRDTGLARDGTGRGRDVSQPGQKLVQGGLSVADRGAFVVSEVIETSIRCRLALASRSWALEESFGV